MEFTASEIIDLLDLKPLTIEGGYFLETYRSEELIQSENLPPRYGGHRTLSTAIYYLLTPETVSTLHKVKSDEIFHFYLGDSVEMLQLTDDGSGKIIKIGNDLKSGIFPQIIVPKDTWQGAKLINGGKFALFGTTVAPGFEYSDFMKPDKSQLMKSHPQFSDFIEILCK